LRCASLLDAEGGLIVGASGLASRIRSFAFRALGALIRSGHAFAQFRHGSVLLGVFFVEVHDLLLHRDHSFVNVLLGGASYADDGREHNR
jgi:hypothetical protein